MADTPELNHDLPPDADEEALTSSEPLPSRATPLADLVDETILGTEDSPFGAGTRRIRTTDIEVVEAVEAEEPPLVAPSPPPSAPTAEPSPAKVIRQQQGSRLPLLPLAFGLIGVGALLLATKFVEGLVVNTASGMVILLGSLIMTYIFRFFESGRRERGLFFIAMILMVWGFLLALDVVSNRFSLGEYWALLVAGVGVAFVLTFMFERTHQTGLLFPGILLIFISGVIVAATQEIISPSIQNAIGDYWYLLLSFLGLTLLPTALQDK